jgi:hypothetical protein
MRRTISITKMAPRRMMKRQMKRQASRKEFYDAETTETDQGQRVCGDSRIAKHLYLIQELGKVVSQDASGSPLPRWYS